MSLPGDVLRQIIATHLTSSRDLKSARLVCRQWSQEILLPSVFISDYNADDITHLKCSKKVSIGRIQDADKFLHLAALLTCEEKSSVSSVEVVEGQDEQISGFLQRIFTGAHFLTRLSVAYTGAAAKTFEVLQSWPSLAPSLASLDISGMKLDENTVSLVSRALAHPHCALRSLHAGGNSIGDFASQFAVALQQNTKLSELYLKGIKAEDVLAESFARLLTQNSTLQILDLRENDFTAVGCKSLFEALKTNRGLGSLSLSCKGSGQPEAVSPLIEALRMNTTLKELSLKCFIHSESQESFFEAIKKNTTLTSLSVTHCPIFASEHLDFLKNHKSLRVVSLFQCLLASKGSIIARSLCANQTLRELNLALNSLPASSAKAFAEAIRTCKSLRKIYLHLNPDFGPNEQALLKSAAADRPEGVSCHL